MEKPFRVLSIDGGGIRGIIPALVLAEIERRTGLPACRLFDLVAGTSTGAILSAAIVTGPNGPLYSAAEAAMLYEADGSTIFHSSGLTRARNLTRPRYSEVGMEATLRKYFGDRHLSEALIPLLIPCYELERRTPWFFRSERAKQHHEYDFPLWQVLRAASAAPTYFPPAKLPASPDYNALIDGSVFANNPAVCAYADARRLAGGRPIQMVSLGTGRQSRPIPYSKAVGWGAAFWISPLLDCMFDGSNETADFQVRQLVDGYWRFQTELAAENQAIDDARFRNVRDLRLTAERMIRERSGELDGMCAALTA